MVPDGAGNTIGAGDERRPEPSKKRQGRSILDSSFLREN